MQIFNEHWRAISGCCPQNERVRNDFFGYIQYYALAKHIKAFLRKTLK